MQSKVESPKAELIFGTGSYGAQVSGGQIFNGEKNIGEIGPAYKLWLDYYTLTVRGWQMYYESDILHTVVTRKTKWVVGEGLHLKSEPEIEVLASEGIKLDTESWNKTVETRWRNFTSTKDCDYNNIRNFGALQSIAMKTELAGGDILAICRYTNGKVTLQLIDGSLVQTPMQFGMKPTDPTKIDNVVGFDRVAPNGNVVRNGIELDSTFSPIAYYVRTGYTSFTYERVEVYNNVLGMLQAWLFIGEEYRLDTNRGVPKVTACMEAAKQLDRYKTATLGNAEEQAKIAYYITHGVASDGSNPLLKRLANAVPLSPQTNNNQLGATIDSTLLANQFAASTNKTVLNMGTESEIKVLETSKDKLYFKEFYTVIVESICATFGIPPEVAFMKYEGSFSSSRAGLKDWEHSLNVDRAKFGQLCQMFYNFWLDIQVLTNKIKNDDYLRALYTKDLVVLNAFRYAKWIGANVPHIDPEKEVRAERAKMGGMMANVPLTTAEAATMALNGGNSTANVIQAGRELQESQGKGFTIPADEQLQVRVTE